MAMPYAYTPPNAERIARFGNGEWNNEPNVVEWQQGYGVVEAVSDNTTTVGALDLYDCCILRHPSMGHLCGYVRIPTDHFFFSLTDMDAVIDAHGGITYDRTEGDDRWIGFDCAHGGDFVPSIGTMLQDESYRNVEYVKREVTKIVNQLAQARAFNNATGGL